MRQSNEYLFKIAVVGTLNSGKSSLISGYVEGLKGLGTYKTTIGVDFKLKTVSVNEDVVKLQVWDIAGQERFKQMRASYYRNAKSVMLTYSAIDRESFAALSRFYEEAKELLPEAEFVVVGTHAECVDEREVPTEEAQAFAEQIGAKHFELSLKTKQNVSDAFDYLAHSMHATETKATPAKASAAEAVSSTEKENVVGNLPSTSTSYNEVKTGVRTMHFQEQHQVGLFQSVVSHFTGSGGVDSENTLKDGNDEVYSSITNDML